MDQNKILPVFNIVTAVKYTNDAILGIRRKGFNDILIHINEVSTYPNICAPLAGILEFYREKGLSFDFIFENNLGYIKHTCFHQPLQVEIAMNYELNRPFDKVWKYSSPEGLNTLLTRYIQSLRETASIIGEGITLGLEWCINECMDNVLQHADTDYGYVMASIQPNSLKFNFCLFDSGIGIYNSLRSSKYQPSTALDAITLAMQERVTRDDKIGQGNGLWGLARIVKQLGGSLKISSNGALYSLDEEGETTKASGQLNFGGDHGSTMVDFQLDYSKKFTWNDIFPASNYFDVWLDSLDNGDGFSLLKISEEPSGTGSRQSAIKIKNKIKSVLTDTKKPIILDFDGVNLISSSFADELIGKLITDLGFTKFIEAIILRGVSEVNARVINRSVGQRMAQQFMSYLISEEE